MGFGGVESADEVVSGTDDGVGVRGLDEVGVVVMPLEGLVAREWFSEEEREVALAVEFEVFLERCLGGFVDGRAPVDGSCRGVDDGAGLNLSGPVSDVGDLEGAIPEAVFVATVRRGGAVVAVFYSSAE